LGDTEKKKKKNGKGSEIYKPAGPETTWAGERSRPDFREKGGRRKPVWKRTRGTDQAPLVTLQNPKGEKKQTRNGAGTIKKRGH